MPLAFRAMDAETARHFRDGGRDAYGNVPERLVSDGDGIPCRRCLGMVAARDPYLLVAWRPFARSHAYAETGPVFLHARECRPALRFDGLPPMLASPDYILRGYCADERIVYGTGAIVARDAIRDRAERLLAMPNVASVHIRSARNNCYQCRIEREPATG